MYSRYLGSDRRRFQRLKINLSVFYQVQEPISACFLTGNRELEAITLDISGAGMAFLTPYNIPVKSILKIRFILFKMDRDGLVSFNDPVEVIAEVVTNVSSQNTEYRLGVCFKQVKEETKSGLIDFCRI